MLRAETWILVPRKEAPLSIFSWQVFMLLCYQWHSWGWKKLWRPATLRYFWNIVFHLRTWTPNFWFFGHQPVLSAAHSTTAKRCYEKKRLTVFWNPHLQETKQKRWCCWPGLRLQTKINPRWRKQWLLFTSTHDTDTDTGVCGLLLTKKLMVNGKVFAVIFFSFEQYI